MRSIQPREIEMRIGQLRIERQRLAIGDDGLRLAVQVLEQHAEIEASKSGSRWLRRSDRRVPLRRAAGQVQQPAEIDRAPR